MRKTSRDCNKSCSKCNRTRTRSSKLCILSCKKCKLRGSSSSASLTNSGPVCPLAAGPGNCGAESLPQPDLERFHPRVATYTLPRSAEHTLHITLHSASTGGARPYHFDPFLPSTDQTLNPKKQRGEIGAGQGVPRPPTAPCRLSECVIQTRHPRP